VSQLLLELDAPLAPLDFELVVSKRARRITLRVEPGRGLLVTVPQRFPRKQIPAFVESRRAWIEDALAEIERQTPLVYRCWPPRELQLHAISTKMVLQYHQQENQSTDSPETSAEVDLSHTMVLRIYADPTDRGAVASEIAMHMRTLARKILPRKLSSHALRVGAEYSKVQIRGQRSVWGSYSSSGTLSLNYKILFLSPELADYVMLHELAHTHVLDHSPAFWSLLDTFFAGAKQADKLLGTAGREVPPWLELAR